MRKSPTKSPSSTAGNTIPAIAPTAGKSIHPRTRGRLPPDHQERALLRPISTERRETIKGLFDFDLLPDSGLVRMPVVEALFSCNKRSVWRWVKDGEFPAPRKVSARISAWNVGDLRRTLAERNGGAA